MNTPADILQWVHSLTANASRATTMCCALAHFMEHGGRQVVETGCFRGNPDDGQSTLVLAACARFVGGRLTSIDNNAHHLELARAYVAKYDPALLACVDFILGDSIRNLSIFPSPINFLYLDSFDYSPDNPMPSQLHQLAEVGAAWGKLHPGSALLLDDYRLPHDGKCGLTVQFLDNLHLKPILKDYQLYYRL